MPDVLALKASVSGLTAVSVLQMLLYLASRLSRIDDGYDHLRRDG